MIEALTEATQARGVPFLGICVGMQMLATTGHEHRETAGLGWIGKHTLLLNREAGSGFFLGEIYTDLELPVTAAARSNHCGSCQACIDICPTRAIVAPYELDATRCISYLTIEHRGSIPLHLRAAIGNRIFGCDDCQLICPWNKFAQAHSEPAFAPRAELDAPRLAELAALAPGCTDLWRRFASPPAPCPCLSVVAILPIAVAGQTGRGDVCRHRVIRLIDGSGQSGSGQSGCPGSLRVSQKSAILLPCGSRR